MVDGTVGSKEHKDIDQGARGHKDISLWLEFFSTRMWFAVVMVVDINVSYTFNMGDTLRSVVLVVDDTVDGKDI